MSKDTPQTAFVRAGSATASLDTESHHATQALSKEGGRIILSGAGIDTEPLGKSLAKAASEERFMNERVTVMFSQPATENEPMFVQGGVNGEIFCFARDGATTYDVKRSHLEVIARSVHGRVKQTMTKGDNGEMGYSESMVNMAVYPFTMLQDSNPKGLEWLKRCLRGAV